MPFNIEYGPIGIGLQMAAQAGQNEAMRSQRVISGLGPMALSGRDAFGNSLQAPVGDPTGTVNDGNRLQMAQAQELARQQQGQNYFDNRQGQTSTSGNYFRMGPSPLQQAVVSAKKLTASQLDTEDLSDEQKGLVEKLTNDPTVSAEDFQRQTSGLIQGQRQQKQADERRAVAEQKTAASTATTQGRARLGQVRMQQKQLETEIRQHEKTLDEYGYDPDAAQLAADAPPEAQVLHKALQAKRQQLAQLGQQADQISGTLGQPQQATETKPAGTMSIKTTHPAEPKFDKDGRVIPKSRGKIPPDVVHQYLDRTGNHPDLARQAARDEGWDV